jgi:hypothetical protein
MTLTITQQRILRTAAKRPQGNVCPTHGIYGRAQTVCLQKLFDLGFITPKDGGGNLAPTITELGREALRIEEIREAIKEIEVPCSNCKKKAFVTAEERGRGKWTCYQCGAGNKWVAP